MHAQMHPHSSQKQAWVTIQAFQLLTHPPDSTIAFRVAFNQTPPPHTSDHTHQLHQDRCRPLAGNHHPWTHSVHLGNCPHSWAGLDTVVWVSVLLNGVTRSPSKDIPLLQMRPKIFPMMHSCSFLSFCTERMKWVHQNKVNAISVRTMVPILYNNVLLAIFQLPRNPNSMFLHRFCPQTAVIFLMISFFYNLCRLTRASRR